LQCDDDQRTKYLVAGEYIQFNISEPAVGTTTVNDDKPSQVAVDVSGILNGPLMYETQQSNRTYQQRNDTFRFPRHTSQRRRIQEQPVQLRRNQNEDETPTVPQGNQYDVLSS
jgi:adenylate kinase